VADISQHDDITAELPYPATKLVITKHVFVRSSPLAFGLYILGTFFDKDDNKLWEKEIYLFHEDSRGITIDENEVDEGPSPPPFALEGKHQPWNSDLLCPDHQLRDAHTVEF
jgi:hypothetical protein